MRLSFQFCCFVLFSCLIETPRLVIGVPGQAACSWCCSYAVGTNNWFEVCFFVLCVSAFTHFSCFSLWHTCSARLPYQANCSFSAAHRLATELSHCLPQIFGCIVVKEPGCHTHSISLSMLRVLSCYGSLKACDIIFEAHPNQRH